MSAFVPTLFYYLLLSAILKGWLFCYLIFAVYKYPVLYSLYKHYIN